MSADTQLWRSFLLWHQTHKPEIRGARGIVCVHPFIVGPVAHTQTQRNSLLQSYVWSWQSFLYEKITLQKGVLMTGVFSSSWLISRITKASMWDVLISASWVLKLYCQNLFVVHLPMCNLALLDNINSESYKRYYVGTAGEMCWIIICEKMAKESGLRLFRQCRWFVEAGMMYSLYFHYFLWVWCTSSYIE